MYLICTYYGGQGRRDKEGKDNFNDVYDVVTYYIGHSVLHIALYGRSFRTISHHKTCLSESTKDAYSLLPSLHLTDI